MSETAKYLDEVIGEIWKPIENWPYEVSSFGRIRRTGGGGNTAQIGHILSPIAKSNGYQAVTLSSAERSTEGDKRTNWKSKKDQFSIHRLVYESFYGKIPDGLQINHRDGNKTNNRLSNLECATPQANMKHARLLGLANWKGERNGQAKLTADKVREIRRLDEMGVDRRQIADKFGISRHTVKHVVRRTRWGHID